MEREYICIGATLDSIKTLKDRSFKVAFETQEILPDQGAKLLAMRQSFGWLVFAPENISPSDALIPQEPPSEFKTEKTPCQRLRAVIYRYWEAHKPTEDFETFYRSKMENFINRVKEKIDE